MIAYCALGLTLIFMPPLLLPWHQPDPSQVYNSTWHDGSLRSGSFTFQGSAVYIYGTDVFNPANISFSMNSPPIVSFHYYAGSNYVDRSLFFMASGLDDAEHTVTWILETGSAGGGSASFDYAIVTIDQANTPSTSSTLAGSTTNAVGDTSGNARSSTSRGHIPRYHPGNVPATFLNIAAIPIP
ncbi:hypothetical protein B0H17DRAFT_1204132 [Mycena rosella]|uniref:Uncharacterized protein n=1 Tax=Mycena rosella TaxID=1033263 RepID=A0AAD7DDE6_MYCRO|nr:hypothetical protein B0H17DRAFT_1204132 [Mycena rosella]